MAAFLDGGVRRVLGGDKESVRMHFIWAVNIFGTGNSCRMGVESSALCDNHVIPAVFFVDVRAFHPLMLGAFEDLDRLGNRFQGDGVKFGDQNAGESVRIGFAEIPFHVDKVFPPVIVVEEGGVEAGAVDVNRLAPGAFDVTCSGDVVVGVFKREIFPSLYICKHQIKHVVMICKTRRPNSAGLNVAAHVEVIAPVKRGGYALPVGKVFRSADPHAGEILKGRVGNVECAVYANHGRVCVEAC